MADQIEKQRPADKQGSSGSSGSRATAGSGLQQREQRGMTRYGGGLVSPFDLMRRFSQDVDRMLSSFGLGDLGSFSALPQPLTSAGASMTTWTPSVEITTRGDDLVISTD